MAANPMLALRQYLTSTLTQLRTQDAALADHASTLIRRFDSQQRIQQLGLPADVQAQLVAVDFGDPRNDLATQLRTILTAYNIDKATIDQVVARATAPLRTDSMALGAHPVIAQQLAAAEVQEVTGIARLSATASAALAQVAAAPGAISDATLSSLVDSKALTTNEATASGFSASVYRVTGNDATLASAICGAPFAALGKKAATSTLQLATLSVSDWTAFLTANKQAVPAGTDSAALAASLAGRFSAVHPTAAILGRLPPLDNNALRAAVNAAEPRAPLPAELGALDNLYPGMQLGVVAIDATLSAQAKIEAITRRIGLVSALAESAGQMELLQLNLATDSPQLDQLGLAKLGASADEQKMVLATARTYQRVWSLTNNGDTAIKLLQGGFRSALEVGKLDLQRFQVSSKLPAQQAQGIWERARTSLADTTLTAGAIVDMIHGWAGKYGNHSPSAQDYLKKLAGFQDLFGKLSLCKCEECQSILGPAAYFVDLMKFIDDNLRVQFTAPDAPLDLYTRRPDLWTLELSCANTNNRIALLEIVTTVLENYIARRLGYGGALTDRTAISNLVYKTTFAVEVDTLSQPFSLPLARVGSYLGEFANARSDVATVLGSSITVFAQAELNISDKQVTATVTPDAVLADQSHVYGIAFTGNAAAVDQVDASILAPAIDLDRADLGALVGSWFVAAGGATVSILATKRDANSVQNDVEWVRGLTADALDRMGRFSRLARITEWPITDLDLLLKTLGNAALDAPGLQAIARLHAIMRVYSVTAQEAAALIGALPQAPARKSLFDKLFNPISYVAADGLFPQNATHFVHPSFRQITSAPIDPNLPRLLSGLGVSLDGLASLARSLAAHLAQEGAASFDPNAANENDRYFVLSAANLTLLYRHARLAKLLNVTIDDLFQLLSFIRLNQVSGLPDLLRLLDLSTWYRSSGYRLDDIAMATGQKPRSPATYPDPAILAPTLVTAAGAALRFSNTVFALTLGTTEQGSADLIECNPAVIEPAGNNSWRLIAGIDLTAAVIAIPPSATIPTPPVGTRLLTAPEVRTALQPYLASEVLVRSIGNAFNIPTDKVRALSTLAGRSLNDNALVTAVRGDGPIAPLQTLIAALVPLTTTFAAAEWDSAALSFSRANAALFGPGAFPALIADATHPQAPFFTLEQLQNISTYTRLAQRQTGTGPNMVSVDPADIRAALAAFNAAIPGFPAAVNATVARILGVPVGLVVGLRTTVTLPAVAAAALDQFDRAAQLATALGVDGNTCAALISNDFDALSHAADALLAVVRSRISDSTALDAKLEVLEQPVREAKRDALADYLINSITPKLWSTMNDLGEYFLIDVAAGGCESTSLVVSATVTAQLYVYRALMNLEQDERAANDPKHFVLTVPTEAAAEWEWRKNYRVWQANREVFLWPENYMVPNLRDDKTPLFEDIENELLQTSLTDQDVLDAYTKYFAGLNELANLTIAGAFHEMVSGNGNDNPVGGVQDVLHLFGCTADDPPVYYYRTCQNLIAGNRQAGTGPIWSAWKKVNVQITGRRVAPVMHLGRLRVFWNDIRTRSKNAVSNGGSQFSGYTHKMKVKFTTLRADGMWTPAQELRLPPGALPPGANPSRGLLSDPYSSRFGPSRGEILDPITSPIWTGDTMHIKYDTQRRSTAEAIDDYTLSGPNWDGIWPFSWTIGGERGLEICYRNFEEQRQVDLFGKTVYDLEKPWVTSPEEPYPQLLCAKNGSDTKPLYWGVPVSMPFPGPATANLVIDERRMDIAEIDSPGWKDVLTRELYVEQIATIPSFTGLLAVPGSVQDGILQVNDDVLYLQGSTRADGSYVLKRIGTTLVDEIARRLFEDGVDAVLDIKTQLALAEAGLSITLNGTKILDQSNMGQLDFKGAYGTYYREVFLYLPWLIANALNSNGKYLSSDRWYRYLFDPTANEAIDVTGLTPDEAAHRVLDRVWRYREFRGLGLESLRAILTDPVTIALYKREPFNPWAIARRRISAFQKALVMASVGNLLDWADSLFTQFLPEPVSEAMMLYVMAGDILGPRPVELGDCGAGVVPDDYAHIGPLIDSSSEILIELETWILGWRWDGVGPVVPKFKYTLNSNILSHIAQRYPLPKVASAPLAAAAAALLPGAAAVPPAAGAVDVPAAPVAPGAGVEPAAKPPLDVAVAQRSQPESLFTGLDYRGVRTASWSPALTGSVVKSPDPMGGRRFGNLANKGSFAGWVGRFGWTIITELNPAFCVPANATLLAYWDRLEDRLYKIRHCQDIDGNVRQMALFAPPINPMELVAMQAAGLSLGDVLGTSSGNLPPYRFSVLIERAKSFAATLSGFGASLLSALDRKDVEQLNRLRLTQQMNLAKMTSKVRQDEIDAAQAAVDALNVQLSAAQYRSGFYDDLISTNRNANEHLQTGAIHTASGIKAGEATLGLLSAAFGLTPQVGSPFAMKYGGVELHAGTSSFADVTGTLAAIAEAIGVSAGLEASFDRRVEGWKNLKQLADYDVQALNKQLTGANLRLDIANRSFDLHQKTIDQIQQLLDFADNKFTNIGRYTWLASKLQLLYREAYQNALAMGILAQQAYRFERGDDTGPGLSLQYWDASNAGLLAGERLLIDLQSLERRFLETNYRTLEIDQPFSLAQIDPQALIDLRETGECSFTVSEAYINLFYPGIYKARIKAARVTIPSVTGPYVNISATLTLQDSWIRPTATPGAALVEVPPSRSVSVATSTAQNDAGVFELSFRDERYMPFEGLGVVSQWGLRLPKTFRPFDYQTMNDVILSISYTAMQDGALRDQVEKDNAKVAASIVNYFTNNPAKRAWSLRQDFSSTYTRMLRSPVNTPLTLTLGQYNMPLFARGRKLNVTRSALVLKTASGKVPAGFAMAIDGTAIGAIAADPTLGNLPAVALPPSFAANLFGDHTLSVTAAGALAPAMPPPGDTSSIDSALLLDMMIYIEYQFQ